MNCCLGIVEMLFRIHKNNRIRKTNKKLITTKNQTGSRKRVFSKQLETFCPSPLFTQLFSTATSLRVNLHTKSGCAQQCSNFEHSFRSQSFLHEWDGKVASFVQTLQNILFSEQKHLINSHAIPKLNSSQSLGRWIFRLQSR